MDNRYVMRISLNVLNHMGLHLYSNTPAVLAEVIANAWDADATEVHIDLDKATKSISVKDNGVGMDLKDVNEKFLYVGYQKRSISKDFRTDKGRKPMGRKGIGKLSLFSIANRIEVHTKKKDKEPESFLMDADVIRDTIETENSSVAKEYQPQPINFEGNILEHGTTLKITDLKKVRITEATTSGLKKRLARRFSIFGDDFRIFTDGVEVTFHDRDYFHKARFIFQYGHDYSRHCPNLDRESDSYDRLSKFDKSGNSDSHGVFSIKGWIGIAHRSNDLDSENREDNLNKIAIVVRGKVAQDDVLKDFRLGGMITKYMFGEISADFLDKDDEEDIATSSRQSISEEDYRFQALKSFLHTELKYIWTETNKLKEKRGLDKALRENLPLKEWYEGLPTKLRPRAARIFAEIDKANIDEQKKRDFYANGVLAFERLKMDTALELLNHIDETNVESFLRFLADIDAIEAASYREIVSERLKVIQKLQRNLMDDARERVLQGYIFDRLWLLDPAWERATQYANMEKRIQAVLPENGNSTQRTDIRYRRVAAAHVVLELKRGSRRLKKTEIEEQLGRYIRAVKEEVSKDPKQQDLPVEGICLVGEFPLGWDNPEIKDADEESLRPLRIRVMTYQELINNAESGYAKFIESMGHTQKLNVLLENIRNYPTDMSS